MPRVFCDCSERELIVGWDGAMVCGCMCALKHLSEMHCAHSCGKIALDKLCRTSMMLQNCLLIQDLCAVDASPEHISVNSIS